MTAATDTIADLWSAIEETPTDWGRWLILADAYAETGDDDGESYCRWIAAKKRVATHYSGGYVYGDHSQALDKSRTHLVPHVLDVAVWRTFNRQWFGVPSIVELNGIYLAAWRTLTDSERAECFAWKP